MLMVFMRLVIMLILISTLTACGSSDAYESQQVAWDNMSYTDSYEKLNGNMLVDLASKIK
jgi:major membrane immunogen (membrane-anchored lipoprotein)